MALLTRALAPTLALALSVATVSPGLAGVSAGDPAPAVAFVDMEGESLDLKDLRGRVVVLDFWATWCPPCVAQLEGLNRYLAGSEDARVVVLAASIDDDRDTAASYLAEKFPGARFRPVHDPSGEVLADFAAEGIPALFVIGPDGVVRHSHFGPGGTDGLGSVVAPLLPADAPSAPAASAVD